jgi:hypothetical protein
MTEDTWFTEARRANEQSGALQSEPYRGHFINEVADGDGFVYSIDGHPGILFTPAAARGDVARCVDEKRLRDCPVQAMGDIFGRFDS